MRAVRGRILDVAVDIRRGSPTYGQWISAELSAENGKQLYIPVGYAHGFSTLEPDTEVLYKVTDFYDRAFEGGVDSADPAIGIDWHFDGKAPLLSPKDAVLPKLADFQTPFEYDGVPMELVEI